MPIFGIIPKCVPSPYLKLHYEANEINTMAFNGVFQDLSLYEHILIPDNIDPKCAKAVQDPVTLALSIAVDEIKLAAKIEAEWKALREKRNKLLTDTDCCMLSDYPITDEARQSIIQYRQALRDLPSNTTDPFNVTWPTKP